MHKALDEYKDYFVISKDESIQSILSELYGKRNADPEEFKKATSNTTDKVLNIIDKRWEQVRQNAEIFKNHYADMSKVKVSRVLRKKFLSKHQKFFSMGKHAENAQNALNNTKQIVDASFLHKTKITHILTSTNQSQFQKNIAQPNKSQMSVTLSPIRNTQKSQLQI